MRKEVTTRSKRFSDDRIIEAEFTDDGKESVKVACDCGDIWLFEEHEFELKPWPHVTCPNCGAWIPLF